MKTALNVLIQTLGGDVLAAVVGFSVTGGAVEIPLVTVDGVGGAGLPVQINKNTY